MPVIIILSVYCFKDAEIKLTVCIFDTCESKAAFCNAGLSVGGGGEVGGGGGRSDVLHRQKIHFCIALLIGKQKYFSFLSQSRSILVYR